MSICCDFVFGNENKINNFNRSNFEKLLWSVLQNNFSGFVDKNYNQIDVVTTGSLSGCSLTIYFCIFISKYDSMNITCEKLKPVYDVRYVGDIHALFHLPDCLEKFPNYLRCTF